LLFHRPVKNGVFSRAFPNRRCTKCGHPTYFFFAPTSDEEEIALSMVDRRSGRVRAYLPIVATVCDRCGDLEHYSEPELHGLAEKAEKLEPHNG